MTGPRSGRVLRLVHLLRVGGGVKSCSAGAARALRCDVSNSASQVLFALCA